jgi:hypothetical protein
MFFVVQVEELTLVDWEALLDVEFHAYGLGTDDRGQTVS